MTVTASARTANAGHGRSRALLALLAVPCVVFGLAYVVGATTAPVSQGQAQAQAARLLGAPPKVVAVAAAAVPSLRAAPRTREVGHRAPATTTHVVASERRTSPAPATATATTGGSPPVAATPVTTPRVPTPRAPTVTTSPTPAGGGSPSSGTGSRAKSGTGTGSGGSAHSGSGSEGDSAGTGSGGG
jgi:uncharacterized membrane protein YgcG